MSFTCLGTKGLNLYVCQWFYASYSSAIRRRVHYKNARYFFAIILESLYTAVVIKLIAFKEWEKLELIGSFGLTNTDMSYVN